MPRFGVSPGGCGLPRPLRACRCGSRCPFYSLAGRCCCELPRFKASRRLSLRVLTPPIPAEGRGAYMVNALPRELLAVACPLSTRPNPRSHDHHHRTAASAENGCARLDPRRRLDRGAPEQHLQQGDQALAVGVQKAKVARTPESLGQHMLQHQPQELCAGHGRYAIPASWSCRCDFGLAFVRHCFMAASARW